MAPALTFCHLALRLPSLPFAGHGIAESKPNQTSLELDLEIAARAAASAHPATSSQLGGLLNHHCASGPPSQLLCALPDSIPLGISTFPEHLTPYQLNVYSPNSRFTTTPRGTTLRVLTQTLSRPRFVAQSVVGRLSSCFSGLGLSTTCFRQQAARRYLRQL